MTTSVDDLIASIRADRARLLDEARASLVAIATAELRMAIANTTAALSVHTALETLAPTEFPIQPDDEPTTVELALADRNHAAAVVFHLRKALAHLEQAQGAL